MDVGTLTLPIGVGRMLLRDGNRQTWPLHVIQVEALLDRVKGQPPAVAWLGEQFERLGYCSWAYRVVNTASAVPGVGSLDRVLTTCCKFTDGLAELSIWPVLKVIS